MYINISSTYTNSSMTLKFSTVPKVIISTSALTEWMSSHRHKLDGRSHFLDNINKVCFKNVNWKKNAFIVHLKRIWSLLVPNKMVKKLRSTEGTTQEEEEKKTFDRLIEEELQVSAGLSRRSCYSPLTGSPSPTNRATKHFCGLPLRILQISLVFQDYLWMYRKLIINPLAERIHGQHLSRTL